MKISKQDRSTTKRAFPTTDRFKYLSAGATDYAFPTQRTVLSRTIEVLDDDAHVTVYFPDSDRIEGDIKTENIYPLLAFTDFLIIDSKTHHIVDKLIARESESASDADVIIEYADVPQATPAQADKTATPTQSDSLSHDFVSKAPIPREDVFKYLSQGSVLITETAQETVVNRLFRISEDGARADVMINYHSGNKLQGSMPVGEVATYIQRGDFYASPPQYHTHVIERKRLLANTFSADLAFSPTPVPPY